MCLCKYHENTSYLLKALGPHVGLPQIENGSTDFLEAIVCDPKQKKCMTRSCNVCFNIIELYKPSRHPGNMKNMTVSVKQWVQTKERLAQHEMKWTLQKCFDTLKSNLKQFLTHVFVKRVQSAYFEKKLKESGGKMSVLQVDFAENFTIKSQHEIQSAHWRQQQCTIFTGRAWSGDGKTRSLSQTIQTMTSLVFITF